MNIKSTRHGKIKNYLRLQSQPSSISEIHEALKTRMHEDFSRKTIERDILDLMDMGQIECQRGVPSRYYLVKPNEIEILLKVEELEIILELLDPNLELHKKLKRCLSSNGI